MPLQGRCMDPLLISGDLAKVTPTTHYSKGYLYLFELPDGDIAVHRLIDINDNYITMKGDRARSFEIVPYQNIIGVVSEVKLLDCESWSTIKQTHLTLKIISYISKKKAKDNRLKNENKLDLLINKICSKFLASFSYSTRKHWIRNCRASFRTGMYQIFATNGPVAVHLDMPAQQCSHMVKANKK